MKGTKSILTVVLTLFSCLCMSGCSNKLELPKYTPTPATPVTKEDLTAFSGKVEPVFCGSNLVSRFIEVPNSNWGRTDKSSSSFVTYPDVCEWLGAFWFLEAAIDNAILKGDDQARQQALTLMQGIVDRYDDVITGKTTYGNPAKPLITDLLWRDESNRVDYYIWGAVSLHIASIMEDEKYSSVTWRQTREEYLAFGLEYADNQWAMFSLEEFNARFGSSEYNIKKPFTISQDTWNSWNNYMSRGYSWQTRLWIDDMFMITALQIQAYRATRNDPAYNTDPQGFQTNSQNRYLDRAVREMKLYIEEIQGADGLYWHSPSAKFLWARGNGWMAVGMPQMLQIIEDIPDYSSEAALLKEEYKAMMASLYKYQQRDGCWAQLIDHPTMWTETSGSAMFAYAFIKGVQKGWLDEATYSAAAKRAWSNLVLYLDGNYDLKDVCVGTGTGGSVSYYENREKTTGDTHGQAGMLWCTTALTELANDLLSEK